jgi:hypothetical protein
MEYYWNPPSLSQKEKERLRDSVHNLAKPQTSSKESLIIKLEPDESGVYRVPPGSESLVEQTLPQQGSNAGQGGKPQQEQPFPYHQQARQMGRSLHTQALMEAWVLSQMEQRRYETVFNPEGALPRTKNYWDWESLAELRKRSSY